MTTETNDEQRKAVPLEQRIAIKEELWELRRERRAKEEPHAQADLGRLLGGFSQTAIGKAMNHADLGPDVRDALLKFRQIGVAELLDRHRQRDAGPTSEEVVMFTERREDDELSTSEAKALEAEFLPIVEARYPRLGIPALRGIRARPRLRAFDLRTCWEALASVRFEERGEPVTSLDLINLAQARLLDEGSTTPSEPPPPPKAAKKGRKR